MVIIDKQHYREMVNTIANDTEYYETLDKDPHKDTRQKYDTFLET